MDLRHWITVFLLAALLSLVIGRFLVQVADWRSNTGRLRWLGERAIPFTMLACLAFAGVLALTHGVLYPVNAIVYIANPDPIEATLTINGTARTVPAETETRITVRGWQNKHTIVLPESKSVSIEHGLYLVNLSRDHRVDYHYIPLYPAGDSPRDVREAATAQVHANIANQFRSTRQDRVQGARGIYRVSGDLNAKVAAFVPRHKALHEASPGTESDGIYWLFYR